MSLLVVLKTPAFPFWTGLFLGGSVEPERIVFRHPVFFSFSASSHRTEVPFTGSVFYTSIDHVKFASSMRWFGEAELLP